MAIEPITVPEEFPAPEVKVTAPKVEFPDPKRVEAPDIALSDVTFPGTQERVGAATDRISPDQEKAFDRVAAVVQEFRLEHNVDTKKSPFNLPNGDFDEKEAWRTTLDLISIKQKDFRENYYSLYGGKKGAYESFSTNFKKVGRDFKYNLSPTSIEREAIGAWETTQNPLVWAAERGIGIAKGAVDFGQFLVMGAGETGHSIHSWTNSDVYKTFKTAENEWIKAKETKKRWVPSPFAPVNVQTATTDEWLNTEFKRIYVDLAKDLEEQGIDIPAEEEVHALLEQKPGKHYNGAVEWLGGLSFTKHFSSEETLNAHRTQGDVDRSDFWGEMLFAAFAEVYATTKTGRLLLAKAGGKGTVAENIEVGALNVKRLKDFIKVRENAGKPALVGTWLLEPILAPIALLDEVAFAKPLLNDWGLHITKARALKKAIHNPTMTKEALLYLYLGYTMGEGIEQMQEQTHFTIGPTDALSFQFVDTEFNSPVLGPLALTMAWALGSPILARLFADYGLRSEIVYNTMSWFIKSLKGAKKAGMDTKEATQGILGMFQYGLDYVQAGKYNVSGQLFASMDEGQQITLRKMMNNRHQRKMIVNMIISMNDVATEGIGTLDANPALFTAGIQALKFNDDMADMIGARLKRIKDKKGNQKYSDANINAMKALTFGTALGLPIMEGLRIQLLSSEESLKLAPYKQTGRNLIELENIKKLSNMETDKSLQDNRIIKAMLEDLEANNLLDDEGTSMVGDAIHALKVHASDQVARGQKRIANRQEVVSAIDASVRKGDNASLEALTDAVEQNIDDGATLETSIIDYTQTEHHDIFEVAGQIDPRAQGLETITIQDRVNWTWDTRNKSNTFLNTVVKHVLRTKKGKYNGAFVNSYMSVNSWKRLSDGFKRDKNLKNVDTSAFKPSTQHEMNIQHLKSYDPELQHEALKAYTAQIQKKIETLEASKVSEPIEGVAVESLDEAAINKINTEIAGLDKALEYINNVVGEGVDGTRLEATLGNALDGKIPVGNKTINTGELKFYLYKVEDFNRARSKAFQGYNSETIGEAGKAAYEIPFYNYIIDQAPIGIKDTWSPAAIEANAFYRNVAAPLLKTKSIHNFRLGEKYGQSFYQEADVLLALADEMNADTLMELLDEIDNIDDLTFNIPELDKNGQPAFALDKTPLETIYDGNASDLFKEIILGRTNERNLLKKGSNIFEHLEETFNEYNVSEILGEDWFTDADISNLKRYEGLQSSSLDVNKAKLDATIAKQYETEELANAWTRINNNPTAKAIVESFDLGTDLSEMSVYAISRTGVKGEKTALYGDQPYIRSNLKIQLLELPVALRADVKKVFLKGILDTYFYADQGGLQMKPVTLGNGATVSVPAIMDVMKHNGDLLEDVLGGDVIEDLAMMMGLLMRDQPIPFRPTTGRMVKAGQVVEKIRSGEPFDLGQQYKPDLEALRYSQQDIDLYLKEFYPENSATIKISGLHPEAGAQVIGSRFFNMARGMVSPGFVAFEFFLKSFSKRDVKALAKILGGGETTIAIFRDMFFAKNFQKKITQYNLKELAQVKLIYLLAITGGVDPGVPYIDEEASLVDFSKVKSKATGEVITSEEDKIAFARELVDHVMNLTREELADTQRGIPNVYDWAPA